MEYVSLSFTSLLQDILGAVFDTVLAPVLRDVASVLINAAGILIQEVLSNFLLKQWIIFLKAVYFLECIFDVFSGVSPVRVEDVSEPITPVSYTHLGQALWILYALVMGLALAWVSVREDNILYGFFLHVGFNLPSALIWLAESFEGTRELFFGSDWMIAAYGLIGLLLSILLIRRYLEGEKKN